ncbi:hypothetical protein LLG46_05155 [bacterium]|nr:hypothetical protein [bacterium]
MMREDRTRDETDRIHNPEDIINKHDERRAHYAGDVDAFEPDVEIDEELDINDVLTFPHPKRKKTGEIGPAFNKEDTDEDWDMIDQDFQPEDYEHGYEGGSTTFATDNMDEIVEERVHEMGHLASDDVPVETEVEVMPNKFEPDKETEE